MAKRALAFIAVYTAINVGVEGFTPAGVPYSEIRRARHLPVSTNSLQSEVSGLLISQELRADARRGLALAVTRLKKVDSNAAEVQQKVDLKEDNVQIFDGVFSSQIAEALGDCPPGVYQRNRNRKEGASVEHSSAAEIFVESVLVEAGDEGNAVEYWGRTEWLGVETHRDCDESAASQTGIRRFPDRVYIAYLDIQLGLIAPTVLWAPDTGSQSKKEGRLWAVPAVTGRVVSFEGSLLHSVPRPACQFLDTVDAEPAMTKRRHVLIINSWSDHAPNLDDDEYDTVVDRVHPTHVHTSDCLKCAPRHLWQPATAQQRDSATGGHNGSGCSFAVSTFGNDSKDFITKFLYASKQDVGNILQSSEAPCWLTISASNMADLCIGVPSEEGSYRDDDLHWRT